MSTSRRYSLRVRGLAASVEVSDRVLARLPARRVKPAPALELAPAPALRVLPRSSRHALDFLREASLAGDGETPSPELAARLAATQARRDAAETLAEKVAANTWYHTIELPDGLVTPGRYDHRPLVPHYGLPDRLDGRAALDVATFDGFWAFELERRGAQVTAVDLPSLSGLDLPGAAPELLEREGLGAGLGVHHGFTVASEALGSAVTRVETNIYDLDPAVIGTFDLVHAGDVLLHLERPLEALRRLRAVTRGSLVLSDCFDPSLQSLDRHLTSYLGGWRDVQWWHPSLDTLAQMVIDAGFDEVVVPQTYRLATTDGGPGLWRAVIHARGG